MYNMYDYNEAILNYFENKLSKRFSESNLIPSSKKTYSSILKQFY
jgi:hypothetical protein